MLKLYSSRLLLLTNQGSETNGSQGEGRALPWRKEGRCAARVEYC